MNASGRLPAGGILAGFTDNYLTADWLFFLADDIYYFKVHFSSLKKL
jgi:hypothetical protein